MVEQEVKERSQEELDVINNYQRKRKKTLSLVVPTVLIGLALTVYGGIQIYKTSNPLSESVAYQYNELTKEKKDIGNSLRRLELIDEKNKYLKDSLANLVTEYKIREETIESEMAKAEETDEIKSYNRDSNFSYGVLVGGFLTSIVTSFGYSFHALNEVFKKNTKLIDVRYGRSKKAIEEKYAKLME